MTRVSEKLSYLDNNWNQVRKSATVEPIMLSSVGGEEGGETRFLGGGVIHGDHHCHVTVVVHVWLGHIKVRVNGE